VTDVIAPVVLAIAVALALWSIWLLASEAAAVRWSVDLLDQW
jgi:hypothetical protein